LVLPKLPRLAFDEIRVPGGGRFPCKFNIRPGKAKVRYGNGVAIRQIYKGEEVGRIGWQFAPEVFMCDERKQS
jgi:hypothetical protein